jgi:hypothetical protein
LTESPIGELVLLRQ